MATHLKLAKLKYWRRSAVCANCPSTFKGSQVYGYGPIAGSPPIESKAFRRLQCRVN